MISFDEFFRYSNDTINRYRVGLQCSAKHCMCKACEDRAFNEHRLSQVRSDRENSSAIANTRNQFLLQIIRQSLILSLISIHKLREKYKPIDKNLKE